MKREIIASDKAPAAVGPYSQAVRIGNLVYTAGQIALDPATGKLVKGETPEETIQLQTRQALNNLSAVLEAAESSLANVIKTTVYLRSIKEYAAMNEVYAEFFPEAPPARSAFAVGALPLGARIEIEVVALVPEAGAEPAAADEIPAAEFLEDAITSIESAVATGLRELSTFFAELQAQVEGDDDDDDDGNAKEKKEKKAKKKKDKKKKDKKGKKKKKKKKKD